MIRRADHASPIGRDAVWRRDELLMALGTAVATDAVDPSHPTPAVVELARLLADDAVRAGRALTSWSRSPRAVALKVNALRRGIQDQCYAARLGAEAAAVLAEHRRLRGAAAAQDHLANAGRGDGAKADRRGPVPSECAHTVVPSGADASVYAMILTGAERALTALDAGPARMFKVGRSNDLMRRADELNWGLPQRLDLRWEVFAASRAMTPLEAHATEQSVLDRVAALGLSAGREFARCRPRRFAAVLAEFDVIARSDLRRARSARARTASSPVSA